MKPVQENLSLRRLHDPVSSYKCFEVIATPSPIKTITCDVDTIHYKDCEMSTKLNHATSLDSLVNSSDHELSSSESDADSITDFGAKTLQDSTEVNKWNKTSQRKSDLENFQNSDPQQEPVIKAYLEKSHLKCDYKNCGYKKLPESIRERNNIHNEKESDKNDSDCEIQDKKIGKKIQNENAEGCDTISTVCTSSAKNRRLSVASSGSVGRMETIVEEPIEAKISVKEILARFETLNSLEVGIFKNIYILSVFFWEQNSPYKIRFN